MTSNEFYGSVIRYTDFLEVFCLNCFNLGSQRRHSFTPDYLKIYNFDKTGMELCGYCSKGMIFNLHLNGIAKICRTTSESKVKKPIQQYLDSCGYLLVDKSGVTPTEKLRAVKIKEFVDSSSYKDNNPKEISSRFVHIKLDAYGFNSEDNVYTAKDPLNGEARVSYNVMLLLKNHKTGTAYTADYKYMDLYLKEVRPYTEADLF